MALLGAAGILAAYAGVQLSGSTRTGPTALLLNLVGATLVLISLIEDFNWAAFVLEIAWIAIAGHGLFKLASPGGASAPLEGPGTPPPPAA